MRLNSLDQAITHIISICGTDIRMVAPLGLGKPHRLINSLYDRIADDSHAHLEIYTALSLTPPMPSSDLEKRFLQPFLDRHFGLDFQSLKYAVAQRNNSLPDNIKVHEFYMPSGAYLHAQQAQQAYISLNYSHVARVMAKNDFNLLVQKVARSEDGKTLCLSCNPDITFDLLDELQAQGKARPLMVAEVDANLPFIGGSSAVAEDYFDVIVELPGPSPKLFALPRQSVSLTEYAIGLRASALVKDGGTLQIGIGSLSDALCHALILRHTRNADYRCLLETLAPGFLDSDLVRQEGGSTPFVLGLYGASEMLNDSFMRLRQVGILTRRVVDDLHVMQRENQALLDSSDKQLLERHGHWCDGGFYLGSTDFYQWLKQLPEAEKRGLGMTRISHINELYGGNETVERLQRRDARFFNTCMMMTVLGAATSDALANNKVISGVGGQYNFVAMAHALRGGRSVLMFRALREQNGRQLSNVLWNYGHTTIPRHLRDIAISEYGIADLRGATDQQCIEMMLTLCDSRFQENLLHQAKNELKLDRNFHLPADTAINTAEHLQNLLQPFQVELLPEYPLGCDFTVVELRIAKALLWLKARSATRLGKARLVFNALQSRATPDREALARMDYVAAHSLLDKINAKVLAFALHQNR